MSPGAPEEAHRICICGHVEIEHHEKIGCFGDLPDDAWSESFCACRSFQQENLMRCQNCTLGGADLIECDGTLVIYCRACQLALCERIAVLPESERVG